MPDTQTNNERTKELTDRLEEGIRIFAPVKDKGPETKLLSRLNWSLQRKRGRKPSSVWILKSQR